MPGKALAYPPAIGDGGGGAPPACPAFAAAKASSGVVCWCAERGDGSPSSAAAAATAAADRGEEAEAEAAAEAEDARQLTSTWREGGSGRRKREGGSGRAEAAERREAQWNYKEGGVEGA